MVGEDRGAGEPGKEDINFFKEALKHQYNWIGIAGVVGSQPLLMVIALFVFLAAGEEQAQVQTRFTIRGLPVSAAMAGMSRPSTTTA